METKDVILTRFTNDLAIKLEFVVGERPIRNVEEKAQERADELLNQYRLRYPHLFNQIHQVRITLSGDLILAVGSPALDSLINGST